MQDNIICQDHQKEFIYFYFGLEQQKQYFCQDCLQSLSNEKEIIKLLDLKKIVMNELSQLQIKQQKYQSRITSIQTNLEENLHKQNQLTTIIQEINNISNENIKNLIKENALKEKNQISLIHDIDLQEDTLQEKLLQNKFYFSKNHKNESIEICEPFLIRQKKQTMNSLAVIEPELDQFQPTTIYLKINRLCQSVAVGFCELNILVKNKYKIQNWDSLGHGCYLLSSSGYSYNSQNLDSNYRNDKGFSFKENQILKISYDPLSKLLNISLINYPEKQLSMKINLDSVYACVYVSKPKDEIEIVQI